MSLLKKCLLIGINYTGTNNALSGCINDSENLKEFLIKNEYFTPQDITMVNDNNNATGALYPTKANIWAQLNSLVLFANSAENIGKNILMFISYSGHGSYVADTNGDEADRRDEVLCPIDFDKSGFILDDDLKAKFVNKLPANVKLIFMSDSCHSGSVLDLKYNYLFDAKNTYKVGGDMKDTKCSAFLISGCRDDQTSADAFLKDNVTKQYEYQGAMTASFIANFNKTKTCTQLISDMRVWLRNSKYTQVPQFSSGKQVDVKKATLF
jgi:hypothetical protein